VTGAGSNNQAIGELRQRIEQDQRRLASLSGTSPASRRLRRQIVHGSARLRALEKDERLRADQVVMMRILSVAVGAILVLAGWGSWTLLTGIAVAAFGVWIADRLPDHLFRTGLGFHRRAE